MLAPITLVDGASIMEELGFSLKSMETHGSSQYPSIPEREPPAASLKAALTSSAVVSFPSSTTRSTRETTGTGTLTASPSSLPFSPGNTRATALAAPVVVGIMERQAARALLRSLWGRSSIFWSFV